MISTLTPSSQQFLADLARLEAQTNKAQREISSGFQIQTASDAPDQIGALLQLEAQFASNKQSGTNLTSVKAEVDTAEQSLGGAVTLLDQAITFGAQGAGSSAGASGRLALADQVRSLQEQ